MLYSPADLNSMLIVMLAPSSTFHIIPVGVGAGLLVALTHVFERFTCAEPYPLSWQHPSFG